MTTPIRRGLRGRPAPRLARPTRLGLTGFAAAAGDRPPLPITRRRFLGGTGLTVGGLVLGPGLLAACGDDDDAETGGGGGGGDGGGNELYFANWPLYIDEESVGLFEDASGISMNYTEEFNDNNEYFARVQPVLSEGDTIEPDLIAPTFWLAARLIELGWIDALPLDQAPNASANLRDDLVEPVWDPTGEYTLPWQTGITGIAYNAAAAGRELGSIADLFDPAFSGRIGMLTEMRDTVGLLMLASGADPSEPSFDSAADAFAQLEQAVNDGQIRAFTGNDYQDDLVAGNYVACVGWSGDVAQLTLENDDLRFVIPEEGGMSWADVMVMPRGARNVDAVAEWLEYVYDPANAARITEYVQYISPVKGVDAELTALGGDAAALVDNPLVFPDDETLSRLHSFGPLGEEEEAQFDEEFARISGV